MCPKYTGDKKKRLYTPVLLNLQSDIKLNNVTSIVTYNLDNSITIKNLFKERMEKKSYVCTPFYVHIQTRVRWELAHVPSFKVSLIKSYTTNKVQMFYSTQLFLCNVFTLVGLSRHFCSHILQHKPWSAKCFQGILVWKYQSGEGFKIMTQTLYIFHLFSKGKRLIRSNKLSSIKLNCYTPHILY